MTSENSTPETAKKQIGRISDDEPLKHKTGLAQRILTLGIVVAMLAGMVFALAGCQWLNLKPKDQIEQQQNEVSVFFTKSKGSQSVTEAVVRPVAEADKKIPVKTALTELLKGPSADEKRLGYFSEIPSGTELLSVNNNAGTVTVDFSEQFASGGGANSVIQRLAEVQNTVISAVKQPNGEPLKINVLVNGKPLQTLGGEGLEVPQTANQPIQ